MKEIVDNPEALCEALKTLIINTLKLEGITSNDIDADAPLFREGLGLDSIDALELVVALEKTFGVIIEDEDVGKRAFASINALAAFVREHFAGEGSSCNG